MSAFNYLAGKKTVAASTFTVGVIDVFARGSDGAIWYRDYVGGSSVQHARLLDAAGTVAHRGKSQRVAHHHAGRHRTKQQRDKRDKGERREAAEGSFRRRDDQNALRIRFCTKTPR